jgi:Piwi domain
LTANAFWQFTIGFLLHSTSKQISNFVARMSTIPALSPKYRDDHTTQSRPLATNGFALDLTDAVEAVVRDLPDGRDVKLERERLAGFWFIHWVGGKLYHLRLKAGGPNVDGVLQSIRTSDHPWLLRSRIDDVIGDSLSKYIPIKKRPFTFLAQKTELIEKAATAANIAHPLLGQFRVIPRFALHTKIYEISPDIPRIGVFVTIGTRYEIDAPLEMLRDAALDLTGMYVVRRAPKRGERYLLGRVKVLADGRVQLNEATDGDSHPIEEVKLEGTKENFARCLTGLLGAKYKRLMTALDEEEATYRLGPAFDGIVETMGRQLRKYPVNIAQGITAQIKERIVLTNTDEHICTLVAPPVDYVFDRTGAKSSDFAWPGLSQYGPYDRTTFANKSPRLLVAFPTSTQGKVEAFLKSFRDGMGANFRGFPKGFRDLFGLSAVDFLLCPVNVAASDKSGSESRYRHAIEAKLAAISDEVHGALIFLLDEHAFLPGLLNPYIRTKSLLLTLGIPTQEVRMWTVNQQALSLQYTLQNFAISVYAKLNGTPWTVNQDKAISDELVIGVGFAELSGSRSETRQRYIGITTVFSGDGTYLLGNVSKECAYEGYADMVRSSMLSILKELKARNNWHPGDTVRVIFHAHRPLKRIDVAKILFACTREIGSDQDIQLAFVTVSHEHPFFIMDRKEKGVPVRRDSDQLKGAFAPVRGTIAKIGRATRLLAVNSGRLIKRPNSPLPKPLLISLHPDSTFKDVDYLAEQALKFTSLSWRSTLPTSTPVTIFYSERIAELLARLKDVPDWSPTAIGVKLKWSRWFL